ncbi:MAG: DinB family protein [Candidatus Eisenbacteria bacterium]|uniref:DinB family protein n=1 Tax=Eiseniibacteriota bacterium TaxID=2212470 RepID=A0A948W6C3_UNCEI|nr:DinB family protein [Candidatus Eisenbacteria bacterium]MBU1948660.1 DinB family protein [Candidatus Eisenbacteria bacterium]MBU2690970.1 DinB family protein [Candidatus Eisenbacteria bacterium]
MMDRMESNADVIKHLVHGVPAAQAAWKPAPDKWSLLEVMVHLLDEEREDFRVRVDILLNRPGDPWPPINPTGWVTEREYAKRDLEVSLLEFLEERSHSVAWLRSLPSPAWDNFDKHPIAGKITAGDIFSSWVAHDFLHIRQLTRLHFNYLQDQVDPHSLEYAGDW